MNLYYTETLNKYVQLQNCPKVYITLHGCGKVYRQLYTAAQSCTYIKMYINLHVAAQMCTFKCKLQHKSAQCLNNCTLQNKGVHYTYNFTLQHKGEHTHTAYCNVKVCTLSYNCMFKYKLLNNGAHCGTEMHTLMHTAAIAHCGTRVCFQLHIAAEVMYTVLLIANCDTKVYRRQRKVK